MNTDERTLWVLDQPHHTVTCVLRSCCAGAELQLRIRRSAPADEETVLRELYPMKADLYERARQLKAEYEAQSAAAPGS